MHSPICIALLFSGYILTVAGESQAPVIQSLKPLGNLDSPGDVNAKSDEGFTLECTAKGVLPMTFSWKKTDQSSKQIDLAPRINKYILSTSGNVGKIQVMFPLPNEDNGDYQCFVENSHGKSFSRKLRLAVSYSGPFVEKKEVVKDVDVTVGKPLTLECPPRNHRFGNSFGVIYDWGNTDTATNSFTQFKQSQNVAMTQYGNLIFLYVSDETLDTISKLKNIQCDVKAGESAFTSHQFRLVKKGTDVRPFMPAFPPNGQPKSTEYAVQGKQKALFCIAQAYPAPKTTWVKVVNGKETAIEDGKKGYSIKQYGRNLVIENVSKEQHEGTYRCIVTNSQGAIKSQFSQLVVYVPPSWNVKPPKTLNIPTDGDGSLTCEALGFPTPGYGWYVNGTKITANTDNIKVRRNKIEFKKVDLFVHAGVYQCVAENSHGMLVWTTVVNIDARKPHITNFGPFYIFKETLGEITCDSNAAPLAQHEWSKDGKVLTVPGGRYKYGTNRSLLIENVQDSDKGRYTCKATNRLGDDSATESATVYERTKITVKPQANVELVRGEPQDLRCEASCDPRLANVLKYKWEKDGAPLKETENVKWIRNQLVLKLYKATINDGAVYTCVAFTDDRLRRSEDRASSIANVKGVPYPPSDLQITNCKNLSTVVTWKSGSSSGAPITHYQIEQESEYEPGVWYFLVKVADPLLTSIKLTLTAWAKLRFRMRAVNTVGPSRASFPTPKGACQTKMSTPPLPTNFRGVPKKAHELDIAWTPLKKVEQNAPNCKYVLWFRKVGFTNWTKVTIEDPNSDKYPVPNPGYYELWEFMIYAKNDIGNGPQSDIKRSRSGQDAPTGKPLNVKKGSVTARTITLTWDRVTVTRGSVDGYVAYHWGKSLAAVESRRRRREVPVGAKSFKLNATDDARQTGTVRGLTPYASYTLVLNAFNSGGEGPSSDEVVFTTNEDVPGEVSSFDVTPFSKYIFAAWGAPVESNGVLLGYAIAAVKHTKGQPDPPIKSVKFIELETNKQEHLFTDVEPEKHYIIYLKAKTKIGYGPVLKARVDTIKPSVPTKPRAPLVVAYSTSEVNVTFLFGKSKGGYPIEFKVKYRNKASNEVNYKETAWNNHLDKRWVLVGELSADLYEFITVGKNGLGESVDSPPTDGRPLPYVGTGQRSTPIHKSAWFIVLLVLIALLLLFVVIVVLYRKRGGAKYPVGKREKARAGMLDSLPPDEEEGLEMSRPEDNPPPYHSDGSIGKRSNSDDDRDSLDDYGEGPQFKEDGSFIEEYGDDKKKLTDGKDKNATATFV